MSSGTRRWRETNPLKAVAVPIEQGTPEPSTAGSRSRRAEIQIPSPTTHQQQLCIVDEDEGRGFLVAWLKPTCAVPNGVLGFVETANKATTPPVTVALALARMENSVLRSMVWMPLPP